MISDTDILLAVLGKTLFVTKDATTALLFGLDH